MNNSEILSCKTPSCHKKVKYTGLSLCANCYTKQKYSKEELAKKARFWRGKNKLKSYTYNKLFFENNKEQVNKNHIINKSRPIHRFKKIKDAAKRRELPFSLTFEQFEEFCKEPCYYCGVLTVLSTGGGLDRVDNDKGYTIDNVLPCCRNCNVTRSDIYTIEETKIMIAALLEFRKTNAKNKNSL